MPHGRFICYTHTTQFKIAVACPPDNDVDIFTNDVGLIVITDDQERLVGFNVTAGGGQGTTHGNKKTYPRIADVLGFVTVEQAYTVALNILLIQRDYGNREECVFYVTLRLLQEETDDEFRS